MLQTGRLAEGKKEEEAKTKRLFLEHSKRQKTEPKRNENQEKDKFHLQ